MPRENVSEKSNLRSLALPLIGKMCAIAVALSPKNSCWSKRHTFYGGLEVSQLLKSYCTIVAQLEDEPIFKEPMHE